MRLRLTGHYENRTVQLVGVQFVDGEADVPNDQVSRISVLTRYYQAHGISQTTQSPSGINGQDNTVSGDVPSSERGSENVPADNRVGSDDPGTGEGTWADRMASNRDRLQHSGITEDLLREAIRSLDPKNSDHWSNTGEPSIHHLRTIFKNPKLTRKQVKDLCPHETRTHVGQVKD